MSTPVLVTARRSSADAMNMCKQTATPMLSSCRFAYADKRGGNVDSRRPPPSSSTISTSPGGISGYSYGSTRRTSSARAPAYSTPVGPPPTMQNVSRRFRSSKSVAMAAGDVDRLVAELACALEAAEAATDDHHPGERSHNGRRYPGNERPRQAVEFNFR